MRKTKLFLTACALMCITVMQAKTNVTNTYLTDADLSALTGWGNPGRTDWKTDGAVNVVEFWNWSNQFNFSQTANLPAGYYRLAVNAFYRNSWGGDGTNNNMAWIFAGEKTQNVIALNSMSDLSGYAGSNDLYHAATAFSQGEFSNEFDFQVTGEGTTAVEIGFKGTCPNGGWCILGPVTLWEYTAADYMQDYRAKKDIATPLLTQKMNAGVLQALQDAIVEESTLVTAGDVQNAVSTLNTAIINANTSIANYTSLKAAIDDFDAKCENLDEDAKAAANAAAADAKAAYTNGTATDGATEKAALNEAYRAGIRAISQPSDGFDMTAYIVNPGIDGNVNGWTCDRNSNGGYTGGPLKPSNDAMEFWAGGTLTDQDKGKTFDYYQKLTGLPEGVYTVTASMLNSTNGEEGANWNGGGKAGLYGSTANDEVKVLVTTDSETFTQYTTDEIIVSAGELRIGVKNFEALTGRWFAADNFQLTYVRQLTDAEKRVEYEKALAAAQAFEEGSIPGTNYTALQAVIAANLLPEGSTSEQYNDATANLNEAATAAAELVEPYATWKTLCTNGKAIAPQSQHPAVYAAIVKIEAAVEDNLVDVATLENGNTMARSLIRDYSAWLELKGKATILIAVDNDNADANATLSSTLTNLSTQISNFTVTNMIQAQQLVAFIPQQVASLKAAMTNYVGVANPVGDGAQFDCTFMLTNPDLTGLPTWTGADGWKTEQTGGNSQVMTNGYATSSDGTKTAFYEYWKNPPTQENVFALYLTTTLSKGTYNMSCYAFAQYEQEGLHENRPNGVYFYANDVQGSAVNNARLSEQSIEFVNSTEQVVKIGLKPVEGNGNTWMGIGYVQLFKVPAVTVTIDEDKDYEPESVAGQVTLKRTLSTEKWNTFVVPFQLTNDELKTAFGDGVAVAEFSEEADGDNSIVNLTTMVTPAISPNKPVLLKPATVNNENTYVFADRTIATGEAKVAGEANFDFVGTYAASTTIAGGDYFISQNKLCKSTGATTIKGTRAYIKAKEGSEARIIGFNLDGGETTAVMDIERGTITTGDVYNMAGQKVKKALKGIYIQNGKKVVIK